MTPEPPESEAPMSTGTDPAKPRGFDIRVLIGGLLGLYGAVLTILGLTDDEAALAKADGLRINLWVGLGLLAVATFFALWATLRPQRNEE